ncbi:MAG TPA: hypothetical protein VF339_16860 [Gammaproteobacteria bacterium]
MSYVTVPAHGNDDRRPHEARDAGADERRARARRNAVLLALLAAAFYVGFILLGAVRGFF